MLSTVPRAYGPSLSFNRTLGGALLITGTCIGAGMLGLPLKTAASGFYPALLMFVGVWVVMTVAALLMLEAALWWPGETNMVSMAHATLGKAGRTLVGVTYILFLYSVMAAYASGGTSLLSDMRLHLFQKALSPLLGTVCFVLPGAAMVYGGARCVDYVNRLLITGLIVAYVALVAFAIQHSELKVPSHADGRFVYFALPLVVTSFGFHLLIPSLKHYLVDNVVSLRRAIILGSVIPLVVYALWEFVILATIPTWGPMGLISMLKHGGNPSELILRALNHGHASIAWAVTAFSFFALASSFVGVALGLYDFFADGFHIKKTPAGKALLMLLTFIAPVLYSVLYPEGFLLALSYASIFAALLLVVYPALIVWRGRYTVKIAKGYRVQGGKPLLSAVIAFGIVVIVIEILIQWDQLPVPM